MRGYIEKSNELTQYVDSITGLDWKEYLTISHIYIEEIKGFINIEKEKCMPEQFWDDVLRKINLISQINTLSGYVLDLSSQINRLLLGMAVVNSNTYKKEKRLLFSAQNGISFTVKLDNLKKTTIEIKLQADSIYLLAQRMSNILQESENIVIKMKSFVEVMNEISEYMDIDVACVCHNTDKIYQMIHLLSEIMNQMDFYMKSSRSLHS